MQLRNKTANALTNHDVRQRGTFSYSAEIVQNQQPNCQGMSSRLLDPRRKKHGLQRGCGEPYQQSVGGEWRNADAVLYINWLRC